MSVIPITVFFSLGLAFVFIALFWREQRRNRFASAERDSLLPLAEETPRPAVPAGHHASGVAHSAPASPHTSANASRHHHGDTRCGCERGEHAPCPRCSHQASPAS